MAWMLRAQTLQSDCPECEFCMSLSCVTAGKLLNLSEPLVQKNNSSHIGCLAHGKRALPCPSVVTVFLIFIMTLSNSTPVS